MRPTFVAVVLAGSLLASTAGQPVLWDQLWIVFASLWSESSVDAGAGFDPSGLSTSDAGAGFDPDGLSASDEGAGFDPDGLNSDEGAVFDPNG